MYDNDWDPAIGASKSKAGHPDSVVARPDSAGLAGLGLLGVLVYFMYFDSLGFFLHIYQPRGLLIAIVGPAFWCSCSKLGSVSGGGALVSGWFGSEQNTW